MLLFLPSQQNICISFCFIKHNHIVKMRSHCEGKRGTFLEESDIERVRNLIEAQKWIQSVTKIVKCKPQFCLSCSSIKLRKHFFFILAKLATNIGSSERGMSGLNSTLRYRKHLCSWARLTTQHLGCSRVSAALPHVSGWRASVLRCPGVPPASHLLLILSILYASSLLSLGSEKKDIGMNTSSLSLH